MKVWLILLMVPLTLPAQTLQQTLAFAQEQYEAKEYEGAIKAYRRVLFFGINQAGNEVFEPLANCYLATGNAQAAHSYLDLAYANEHNDSLRNELLFKKATAFMLEGQYQYAKVELFNLDAETGYFLRKQAFYQGIIAFQQADFDQAESYFLGMIDPSETEIIAAIENIFQQNHRLKRFNPNKVRIMSAVLPGLGQLYCGEYKDAINSLLLVGGLGVLFGYTTVNLSLVDALVSIFPWYQRYFVGGYRRAYRLAEDKIIKERAGLYQELLNQMEKNTAKRKK
ncbi:MAG: hypothetical protein AAF587_01150 [Bacteroidota bacterium]